MNPQDKIPALKKTMPDDPVVDILDDLSKKTGLIADRMDSVEAAGMTLRLTACGCSHYLFGRWNEYDLGHGGLHLPKREVSL